MKCIGDFHYQTHPRWGWLELTEDDGLHWEP